MQKRTFKTTTTTTTTTTTKKKKNQATTSKDHKWRQNLNNNTYIS